MTTILEVLEKGTKYLSTKGVADPRLNMEHMVAHELGLKRMDLYVRFDQPLEDSTLASLREKLKKRGEGIPLQHLNGTVHFHKYEFHCDARALIPRPETEELVEIILKNTFPKPARILDLGCGSGVIGLSLAKELGENCAELTLADFSPDALSLAKENAISLEQETIFNHTDLFSDLTGQFDLIAANLPYVALRDRETLEKELAHDPEIALFSGEDGLDLIRIFVKEVFEKLTPGGLLAMEVGYDQGEIVCDLLKENGLIDVQLKKDLSGIARFPLARRP